MQDRVKAGLRPYRVDCWTAYRGPDTARGKGTTMFSLQVSYPLRDYEAWKKVFDADPAGRAASGARSVRVFRDTEDQNSVTVLLDFDAKDAATDFLERLRSQVWDKPEVIGQLVTAPPTARILEEAAREGQGAG